MSPSRSRSVDIADALRRARMMDARDLAQAERVANERGVDLARASVDLGMLSEDQVLHVVAEDCGLDLVFPNAAGVDPQMVGQFPADLLRAHEALPLLVEEGTVVVAFAEIPAAEVLEEFARHAGAPVRAVLAARRRLQKALECVLADARAQTVREMPQRGGGAPVASRRPEPAGRRSLEDHGFANAFADWLRGPFRAPRHEIGAAAGLVLVAATEPGLVRSFARALADETGGAGEDCPDVVFIGDAAEGTSALFGAANDALSGGRVIAGLSSPSPAAAALDALESPGARHRMQQALAAVVLLDECRALCAACSRPDAACDEWIGARVPAGCRECDGRGHAGTVVVAQAALAGPGLTDRLTAAMAAQSLVNDGSVSELAADLVRTGRVARCDARVSFGRLAAP